MAHINLTPLVFFCKKKKKKKCFKPNKNASKYRQSAISTMRHVQAFASVFL